MDRSVLNTAKRSAVGGAVFAASVAAFTVAFAALTYAVPVQTASTGSTLSSVEWIRE